MYITDSNGNYIPTTTIKGEDGKEVSIRTSAGYIQWKREDTDWTNLVPLDTLMGPSGKKVLLNAVGYILQYKYDGDADWITLCDLSTYFGNTAAATAAAAANAAADRANAAAALCEDVAAGAMPPHASSHGTGGSDPITPASIGAASEESFDGLANYVDDFISNYPNYITPASIGAATASHTHAPADIGAQAARSTFTSKSVATSAWTSNTTYDDYPYRAAVACSGVTAAMFAEVVLSPADATSGNIAPVCQTYAGGVYIYAKAVPDAAITIPTIIVWR